MTEYEDFLMSLYYAKLEWMAMQSGNIPIPWNSIIQRDIDALSGFSFYEIEAHIIATKSHFNKQIDYPKILEIIRTCCIQQGEQRNANAFTMCVYNRIELFIRAKN